MSDWQPPADLTRLLEALAEEITCATDGEVMIASVESGGCAAAAPRRTRARVLRLRELVEASFDEHDPGTASKEQLLVVEGEGACELRHRPH